MTAPGDYVCLACQVPGDAIEQGPAVAPCARGCGRSTGRRLAGGPPPARIERAPDRPPDRRRLTYAPRPAPELAAFEIPAAPPPATTAARAAAPPPAPRSPVRFGPARAR